MLISFDRWRLWSSPSKCPLPGWLSPSWGVPPGLWPIQGTHWIQSARVRPGRTTRVPWAARVPATVWGHSSTTASYSSGSCWRMSCMQGKCCNSQCTVKPCFLEIVRTEFFFLRYARSVRIWGTSINLRLKCFKTIGWDFILAHFNISMVKEIIMKFMLKMLKFDYILPVYPPVPC